MLKYIAQWPLWMIQLNTLRELIENVWQFDSHDSFETDRLADESWEFNGLTNNAFFHTLICVIIFLREN